MAKDMIRNAPRQGEGGVRRSQSAPFLPPAAAANRATLAAGMVLTPNKEP